MDNTNFLYLFLGILLGIKLLAFLTNLKIDNDNKEVEDIYQKILKDKDNLLFVKRINNFVYFLYKEYNLIYYIEKREINIYINDDLVGSTSQISTDVADKFISTVIYYFNYYINENIIVSNGTILSMNIVMQQQNVNQEQEIIKKELSLDDILDKISKHGMESLTPEEKNYLDNQKHK